MTRPPMSVEEKAQKFDELVGHCRWQFEFWAKWWHGKLVKAKNPHHSNVLGYGEGQTHAFADVLRWCGQEARCPCEPCTHERMEEMEACAETGDDHA